MAVAIAAVIATAVKIGAAVVAAYKAYAVVRVIIHIAAMVAISWAATALAAKPGKINQGQELALKLDATMPRQVAAGRVATGGSQAWAFTYGQNGDIPNRYLVRIIALSDRPATGLVQIAAGGDVLTFEGDPTGGLVACNQYRDKKGTARFHVQVILGSDNPTGMEAAWLHAASGGRWTPKHKYVGGAYAVIRSDYDSDAFTNGEPQITFTLDGAKCLDERDGQLKFTRNAAVITSQLLRGFYTKETLILGAQAATHDFQPGYNIAAANICDQPVDIGNEWDAGATEPRYRAGMMLTAAEPVSSMLQDLKNAMDGDIFDRGGQIAILPGAIRTPVLHLTDENLDWSAPRSFQPYSSLQSLYNIVTGSYVSEALLFEQVSFPTQKDMQYVEEDGGEKIVLAQDFRAVNSDTQIQRITKRLLKASRFQKIVAFTGPLALGELQQGDWFTMDSPRWNFTAKYFKALQVTLNSDLRVTIVAQETSPVVDGWSIADEVPRTSTGYLPGIFLLARPVVAWAPFLIEQSTEGLVTKLPAIKASFILPNGSAVVSYNIQYRVVSPENPPADDDLTGIVTVSHPRDDGDFVLSAGVMPGAYYQVRAASHDGTRTSQWTPWDVVRAPTEYEVPNAGGLTGDGLDKVLGDLLEQIVDRIDDAVNESEAIRVIAEDRLKDILANHRKYEIERKQRAFAIQETRVYIDDVYSEVEAIFVTQTSFGDGLAATLELARSYTDAFKSEAELTYATTVQMNDGLAQTLNTSKSYTDAFKTEASTLYYTKAQTDSGLASTLFQAESYVDAYKVVATNTFSTKSETSNGLALTLQQSKAYTDALESYAVSLFATKASLNGVSGQVSSIQSAQVTADGKISLIWGFALTTGNRISGMRAADNGTVAALDFVFDAIRFWNGSQNKALMTLVGGEVAIAGDLVVTGSIKNNAVSKISNVAMGGTLTGFGGGLGTLQQAIYFTGNAAYAANVVVILTAAQSFLANGKAWGMEIWINGGIVAGIGGASYSDSPAASGSRLVAAGTYTVEIKWRGQDNNVSLQSASITVMELFK